VSGVSLKEASERVKKRAQEMKEEVKGTVESLGESLPRPLLERRTLILKEPLLKTLTRRLKERK